MRKYISGVPKVVNKKKNGKKKKAAHDAREYKSRRIRKLATAVKT